jgi:hypothetical protein
MIKRKSYAYGIFDQVLSVSTFVDLIATIVAVSRNMHGQTIMTIQHMPCLVVTNQSRFEEHLRISSIFDFWRLLPLPKTFTHMCNLCHPEPFTCANTPIPRTTSPYQYTNALNARRTPSHPNLRYHSNHRVFTTPTSISRVPYLCHTASKKPKVPKLTPLFTTLTPTNPET